MTHTLRDRRQHIIDDKFIPGPTKEGKRIQESLMKRLLPLAVGKFDIEHPAVGFSDGEGVEFPFG